MPRFAITPCQAVKHGTPKMGAHSFHRDNPSAFSNNIRKRILLVFLVNSTRFMAKKEEEF